MMVLPYGVIGNTTDFGSVIIGSSPIGVTKGVVVQMVRTTVLQAVGRGFEYRQLHECRSSRLADRDYGKCHVAGSTPVFLKKKRLRWRSLALLAQLVRATDF